MEPDLVSLLEPLHHDAYGWARHCCGPGPVDPGDVVQIAYLKVISGKARPRDQAVLKTWWFGVIRFTAMEERRRHRFLNALPTRLLRFGSAREHENPAHDPCEDEPARELREALSSLPTRQSEVLHLVFYQDLSIAEAAAIMRVSLGSARTHYERGKRRLRELLGPTETA